MTIMATLPEGYLDVFSVNDLPSLHPHVKADPGGRAIPYTEELGFLCYGQYRQGYPLAPLRAYFVLAIDDNTRDDRNVLILDVYDHHSDRVIGKRLITRKDFSHAQQECLFVFDFTPPTTEANMEFRVYYMGGAYIVARCIAIIDPAIASITSPADIPTPAPDHSSTNQSLLPDGWQIHAFGNMDVTVNDAIIEHTTTPEDFAAMKKKMRSFRLTFDIDVQKLSDDDGDDPDENAVFVYRKSGPLSGNGKLTARFPKESPDMAVMFRESLEPGSRFVALFQNRVIYRGADGRIRVEGIPGATHDDVREYKLVRKQSGASQYYIGLVAEKHDSFEMRATAHVELAQEAYVGFLTKTSVKAYLGMDIKDRTLE